MFQQYFQQFERLLLNLDSESGFAQFSGVRINFIGPKSQDRSAPQFFHLTPAQARSLARISRGRPKDMSLPIPIVINRLDGKEQTRSRKFGVN